MDWSTFGSQLVLSIMSSYCLVLLIQAVFQYELTSCPPAQAVSQSYQSPLQIDNNTLIGSGIRSACVSEKASAETRTYFVNLMNEYKSIFTDTKTYQIIAVMLAITAIAWYIRKRQMEVELLSTIFISGNAMKSASNSGDVAAPITARVRTMNGKNVFLKNIMAPNSGPLSRKITRHLCLLYDLRHENLVTFLGVIRASEADIVSPEKTLVWELCIHGPLTEVVDNFDIPMDWNFKLSLLMDLARVRTASKRVESSSFVLLRV